MGIKKGTRSCKKIVKALLAKTAAYLYKAIYFHYPYYT